MYKPLKEYLTLKESKIDGIGLFAKTNLEHSVNLGLSHFIYKEEIKREPFVAFCNHSLNPNLTIVWDDKLKEGYCSTLKDVKEGEELTLNYNNVDICGYTKEEINNFK